MSTQPYLTVNVYAFGEGWRAAVLLKRPGRPYPRLLRTLAITDLAPEVHDLPGALEAASGVLRDLARQGRATPIA